MLRTRHSWIAALAIALTASVVSAQQTADTILHGGRVLTVDSKFSTAQAIAVSGTRIAAVGSDAEVLKLAGPNTRKIDLKGKTVIPGLVHTHIHQEALGPYRTALGTMKSKEFPLNVRGLKTPEAVVQAIKDVIAAFKIPPGQWIFFEPNWTVDQAPLIFNRMNALELDKGAPNNPIVMSVGVSVDNNQMMNTRAIQEMFRKYGDFLEKYGRYWVDPATGKPSGIIEAPASRIVWGDEEWNLWPKPEDAGPYFRKMLIESYSSLGLTMISGALNKGTTKAYQWLDTRGEMPLRYAYGDMEGFHPGADLSKYKLGAGTDTVFLTSVSPRATDGGGVRMCVSLPRNDAAIAKAASGAVGDSGDMNLVAAEWWPIGQCSMDIEFRGGGGATTKGAGIKGNYFTDWYSDVAQKGLRAANTHASGDRTVTLMIDHYERLDKAKPGSVKGWGVDHCYLVNPKDIPRIAKLGLFFSCNPMTGISSDEARGARSMLVAYGPDVLHKWPSPFKSMVDAGINVSLEIEGGGTFWDAIETMIVRKDAQGRVWGAHERVDRQTALKIATQNGANYVLKGDQLGSLQAGKLADLLILDRDYMSVPEDQISEIRPLMTMMGGKMIFLRTDFAAAENLKPAGAEIGTYEELQKRRPRSGPEM